MSKAKFETERVHCIPGCSHGQEDSILCMSGRGANAVMDLLVETGHVVDNIAEALRHNEVVWRPLVSYVRA